MILNFIKKVFNKNKRYKIFYILISILFILWMLFLDTHSLKIHLDLNDEIEKLENEKKELTNSINKDRKNIKRLEDIDSLENFEENKKSLDIYIDIKDYSNSDIQISSLDIGQTTKNRLSLSHTILNGALKGSGFNYKEIINSKEKK